MNVKTIAVIAGGDSPEREVSLSSGRRVTAALKELDYPVKHVEIADLDGVVPGIRGADVVFNCLHGGAGENGTVQLLLETMEIPYPGSGPLASALAMDKPRAREAFAGKGLTVPEGILYQSEEIGDFCDQVAKAIPFPLVLKPRDQGSSVGVRIVHNDEELRAQAAEIVGKFGSLLVERYIEGRDLTVGILEIAGKARPLPIVEMRPKRDFYDYTAKYTPGMTEFLVPASLPVELTARVQRAALTAHLALGCRGFSRVDLRLSTEGIPYVLEVNTIPGMTETSDLPQAAEAAGIPFTKLVEHMLESAFCKEVSYA